MPPVIRFSQWINIFKFVKIFVFIMFPPVVVCFCCNLLSRFIVNQL